MSVETIIRKSERSAKQVKASGKVDGKRMRLELEYDSIGFPFIQKWQVWIYYLHEVDASYHWTYQGAKKKFDSLVEKYGLTVLTHEKRSTP